MALTIVEFLRSVNPNIGLVLNLDGISYRIGVEDINSDESLAALAAIGVDLAAIEVINTAIQAACEAILLDTADIEVATEALNTALQAGGITQLQLAAILAAIVASGSGTYTTPAHTAPVIGAVDTPVLAANANRLYACFANDGTETIYLGLGVAAVMNIGIPILSGGSYEMSREIGNLYVGAVNGICASGGMVLATTEGV